MLMVRSTPETGLPRPKIVVQHRLQELICIEKRHWHLIIADHCKFQEILPGAHVHEYIRP